MCTKIKYKYKDKCVHKYIFCSYLWLHSLLRMDVIKLNLLAVWQWWTPQWEQSCRKKLIKGLVLVSEPSAGRKDDIHAATDKYSADCKVCGWLPGFGANSMCKPCSSCLPELPSSICLYRKDVRAEFNNLKT